MNVPSVRVVTLPLCVVANVPATRVTPPVGRSFAMIVPVSGTNGVAGDAVAPPVRGVGTVGQVTVSVAALLLAVPRALVKTARYWLPFCDNCAVKVRLVLVAPPMSVNPEPVLTCHCTVGAGEPLAAAVKVTLL